MAHLRTIVEASWDDDHDNSKEVKDRYYLLHWGLKFNIVPLENGGGVPVHYTVAICQHIKTGVIETFIPEQLKVLGDQIKEDEPDKKSSAGGTERTAKA
jgi:hypothetical protein